MDDDQDSVLTDKIRQDPKHDYKPYMDALVATDSNEVPTTERVMTSTDRNARTSRREDEHMHENGFHCLLRVPRMRSSPSKRKFITHVVYITFQIWGHT